MKKIGVIANIRKPQARPVLGLLAERAKRLGLELVVADETSKFLPGARRVRPTPFAHEIEALVALGGDGTLLHAVRLLKDADVPMLGVNLGSLGFLTSVTQNQMEEALCLLAEGRFAILERTALECTVFRGRKKLGCHRALNDVVTGWGTSARIITLEVMINEDPVALFTCDGLIISTPTGSTGHSLSAGGPILSPGTAAWVVSAICPHTLSHRPLVIPDSSTLQVLVRKSTKRLLLSVDGQEEQSLEQGDRLVLKKSPKGVRFIHLPDYSYFSVLRQKLHWRGSSV